jgi:uncharacterized protein
MRNPLLALLNAWSRRHVPAAALLVPTKTAPTIVVTGASEGIGLAIARAFAQQQHQVVLVARREALLVKEALAIKAAYGIDAVPLAIDVNRADAGALIDAALASRGLHADVLVNNAGFGLSGEFAQLGSDDIDALVACNIVALTRLCRHFLPAMSARHSGGIINIASLAGLTPGPYQAAYYASKAYVISLSRALSAETSGDGVRVMAVTPGPVETGFHARMNAEQSFYRRLVPAPTAEVVARSTVRGFKWHRRVVAPGLSASVLSLVLRWTPAAITIPAIGWLLYPRENQPTNAGRTK